MEARRQVAVIGAGVSGLTAAYLLQRSAEVTLYEADSRLGGHAHTHDLPAGGTTYAVDSGFIVHNQRTYPHLIRLFGELGVQTQETEMSMSVSCRGCGLEYAGAKGATGLFARPANVADPRFLRMLTQIPAFHRRARALLETQEELTLGEFLARGKYNRYFISHFIVPLVSAVWSCGPEVVPHYPARYLFAFLANHGMLSVKGSPTWRTVTGGSRSYVDRIAKRLSAIHELTAVRAVRRFPGGVEVTDESGAVKEFGAAVIATHADDALRMLVNPDSRERAVLGAFEYSANETVLHSDSRVLPRHGGARASWNYLLPSCQPEPGAVRVSYDMNRLQRLDSDADFVVTLNGAEGLDPELVHARMSYRHPVYTTTSVAAQRDLPALSGGTLAFAGAHHGWGFHEDGCRSGVQAARKLGVTW
jgi:predicted NAD/FAD-binding protein